MSEEKKQTLAFGGMPTAPDVRRIREEFPDSDLIEGETEISHSRIAAIVGVSVESSRFKTVTRQWRKDVEDSCGKIITSHNKVFYVQDDTGKLGVVRGHIRVAGRSLRKAKRRGALIDRSKLTDDNRALFERENYRLSKLSEADRIASSVEAPSLIGGSE